MLKITEKEFYRLTEYIQSQYGINLKQKRTLIEGRLSNIVQKKGFNSFDQYLESVFSDSSGAELTLLVNKLTTNHTFFLRERSHFDFLSSQVLPEIVENALDRDLRIWSAGCSTGEEPYTLSMVNADFFENLGNRWDTRILATDISIRALEQARKGIYRLDNLTDLPPMWRLNYFKKLNNENCSVSENIKQNVIFRVFNLMEQTFPFKRKFHVIFCRNVMIYFDRQTKMELVKKFYDWTEPGGYLFIGHSESISRDETEYKYVMPAVYRKG